VRLDFATSSANYSDIFLTASASDLTAIGNIGYFVRIGNTADEICLYRKDGNSILKIIDGTDGVTNNSTNTIKIKVTRDGANQWTLSRDLSGNGTGFINEGLVTDATYNTSAYFGFLIKQSSASFFQKHYFDDIETKTFVPDITPPVIVSATATGSNSADLLFDEPLENISAQVAANYIINNNVGSAATAILDATNAALVHLTFSTSFPNGISNTLTVNGVLDIAGNALNGGTVTFGFYTPQPYDVVIDEIMADPTPAVGLPEIEWIELRNTSAFPISLFNWKIGDGAGLSGSLPNAVLQPDSFLIICTGSSVAVMSSFGPAIAVTSFPSLDNTGELLSVISNDGKIIHSVNHSVNWFQNELKKGGGWTLEMIDTKNPCSGFSNWKASTDTKGGTPGKKNSVDGSNADQSAPQLLRAYTTDSLNITLVFDEPLDISKAAAVSNFNVSDGINVSTATPVAPAYDRVVLKLLTPLQRNKVYIVTVSNLTDCAGNTIGSNKTAKVGLSEVADSLDIVINEILFNPPSNGTDYVEIYNRSNRIIDLKQTYIASRSSDGTISSIKQLSTESYLLFPVDFMVITEDPPVVKVAYITQNPAAFIAVASMPSFSDTEGDVIILNAQGAITDELKYTDKWHFKLLDNKEGVALERIDYDAATQQQDNWHSAATSSGYGTPGYKNSQYRINDEIKGEVRLSPEIVSPDNDGQDDFATISYKFPEPGYVASITIFDATGRPVRYLQRNALCGVSGSFRWDGLREKNQQLASGIYILFTEVFSLNGKRKQFKETIVLARRN
jgi:Lamin Tail Domain/Bacterial Ig-like domain